MRTAPKILISYFFGANSIPLGESCARALSDLGCEVFRHDSGVQSPIDQYILKRINKLLWALSFRSVDVTKISSWGNENYRKRKLEESIESFRPDVVLIIRGHGFEGEFLHYLKEKYGIRKLVGWWVKGPRMFEVMLKDARSYDHYFCIHQEGYSEQDNIAHLPALGVDNLIYKNIAGISAKNYRHEIAFVGSWSARREKFIASIADLPIEIYGPGWRKQCLFKPNILKRIRGTDIWGEKLVRLYNESKIVLNISSWEPANTSGLNLRILDVPATGAFLLSENSPDIANYFESSKEIETFQTAEELSLKIRHYLRQEKERETIAWNGFLKTQRMETFKDKMKFLLDEIGYNNDLNAS